MKAVLLYAKNVLVAFGTRTILNIEELEIRDGARIGLIGDNGAGKSTLISVLSGERQPDAGTVQRSARCAVVRQMGSAEQESARGGISARLQAMETAREGVSGGEMERIRLARALEMRAPLLMADEPTSHLDFEGRREAESLLRAHQGALLLVSHDRALLNSLCTEIWALREGKIRVFPGNYSAFCAEEKRERAFQEEQWRAYTREKARLTALAADVQEDARHVRKAPKRMGNSEARLQKASVRDNAQEKLQNRASAIRSRIENLEVKERPKAEQTVTMELFERPGVISREAIRAARVTLRAGEKVLLRGASFTVPTGRRTVLVGPNGCGKTSLLRYIIGGGYGVKCAPGVKIGYYSQETGDCLRPEESVLQNALRERAVPEQTVRTILRRMGFKADDLKKKISVLSGGERARAALASLLAGDYNVLILDEPGNHLDLTALEALEEMLSLYQGTLLMVSHDRHMIDRVAQRLLVFEDGVLRAYEGNLSAMEAETNRESEARIEMEKLRMRMAEIVSRISAPRRGDSRAQLEAEYDELARRIRETERNI